MDVEEFVDKKEMISALIFDYQKDDYVPPNEEDCNELGELILNALGYYPVE